jgi:hypothetical protein
MKYEEWRALGIYCADMRIVASTFSNWSMEFCTEPCPGVVFAKPVWSDEELSPEITDWLDLGIINQDGDGMWRVTIANEERTFGDLEAAARWLWQDHGRIEYGDETKFKLMVFDLRGAVTFSRIATGEDMMVEMAINQVAQFSEEAERCENDLRRVAARFHEFSQGHVIAIPLEV